MSHARTISLTLFDPSKCGNNKQLIERRAIVTPKGQKLIDTHIFDQLVLEIDSEVALELQQ